jgi:ABC-2 type transport system permease protein
MRSELRRLTSRRAFRVMGLLVIAGVLVAGGWRFFASDADETAGIARAEQYVRECEQGYLDFHPSLEDLEEADGSELRGEVFPPCPSVDDIVMFYSRSFRYAQELESMTRGVSILLMVAGFAVGVSFIGADWGSGSVGTLLLWEPRRHHVLAGKALVAGALVAMAVFLALALLAAAHLPSGLLRGTMEGAGISFWTTLSSIWARSGVLAGMFAMAGVALAMVVRNTAGAIAIGGLYGALGEPLIGAWRQGQLRPWLLSHNVPRFQGYEVQQVVERNEFGWVTVESGVMSVGRPSILLSCYVLVLLLAAYASFRGRDAE